MGASWTSAKSSRSPSTSQLLPNESSMIPENSIQSHKRATKLAVASLVVGCLSIVSVLFLICCFVVMLIRLQKNVEVCLPCVQVSPNPLDSSTTSMWDQLTVKYDEDNAEICCASTSAQFAVLFKLILKRQEAVKELADTFDREENNDVTGNGPSAVSAHLVFKPLPTQTSGQVTKSVEMSREQQWKSPQESPLSHVQGGLRFHNKRILAQNPGRYYVYCQILYTPSHAPKHVGASDVISTYVRRHSILRPLAPDFLLKLRHTRGDATSDRHSSYAGGVFRLNKGDSLYVQVSRPDLVSHDDMASFFGLFRIGN